MTEKLQYTFLILFKQIFLSPEILLEMLYNPGKIIYQMHSKDIAKLCLLIYRAVSEFCLKRCGMNWYPSVLQVQGDSTHWKGWLWRYIRLQRKKCDMSYYIKNKYLNKQYSATTHTECCFNVRNCTCDYFIHPFQNTPAQTKLPQKWS